MSAPGVPQPLPTPVWHMYRALVGVGLVCGLLIVTVYETTRPIIQRNKVEARQRAVFDVLPGAATTRTYRWSKGGAFAAVPADSEGEGLAFAGFDGAGALVGVAIEASGMGYQDVVRVLYGYSVERAAIIGTRVLESRETPGLGDRVESDPQWLRNFERLDVALSDDGGSLLHPIEFTKSGQKQHPWQIDGITGATVTSRAIADMLARSAAVWIARVAAHRTDFRAEDRPR